MDPQVRCSSAGARRAPGQTYEMRSNDARGAQVLGETEVKAQIKLRIVTAAGSPVVIVRSFQVLLIR